MKILVLGLTFMLTSLGVIDQDNKTVTDKVEIEFVKEDGTTESKTSTNPIYWSDWGPWSNPDRGCGERMRIGIEIGGEFVNLTHRQIQTKRCPDDTGMHDPDGRE